MKLLKTSVLALSATVMLSACEKKINTQTTGNDEPYAAMTPGTSAQTADTPQDNAQTMQSDSAQPVSQNTQELPKNVQAFLNQYYSGVAMSKYETKTVVGTGTAYEVKLANGVEVEFDANGNWKEIKDYNGVPAALVLGKISSYANQNYKNIKIKKIDKKTDKNKIKVELLNDTDLEFDMQGNFLRID